MIYIVIENIIAQLKFLSNVLPLELFTFVGTLIEEFIGPIPSPLILITAGSLAHTQGYHFFYIIILSMIASTAKTLISWFFYVISDKAENLIFHKDFEKIRHYFDGSKKDDVLVFLARAIPVFPTALVSFGCGFIKLDLISFLRATFLGFAFRSIIFIYLGYFGVNSYENWQNGQWHIPYAQIVIFLTIGLISLAAYLIYRYYLSSHQQNSKR